jgi:hypothetical protein
MSIARLSALFVTVALLHNLEEVIWLPSWSSPVLPWYRPEPQAVFAFGAVILSLLLVGLAFAAQRKGPRTIAAYLFAGYVVAIVINAVLPHLALTLITRSYMPGTLTGMLLNLPIGTWLLRSMLRAGYVQPRTLAWSAPPIALTLVALIAVLFWVGRGLLT